MEWLSGVVWVGALCVWSQDARMHHGHWSWTGQVALRLWDEQSLALLQECMRLRQGVWQWNLEIHLSSLLLRCLCTAVLHYSRSGAQKRHGSFWTIAPSFWAIAHSILFLVTVDSQCSLSLRHTLAGHTLRFPSFGKTTSLVLRLPFSNKRACRPRFLKN